MRTRLYGCQVPGRAGAAELRTFPPGWRLIHRTRILVRSSEVLDALPDEEIGQRRSGPGQPAECVTPVCEVGSEVYLDR